MRKGPFPMALQSRLFRGDPKLEAAAISDPAHIIPGDSGSHVGKIQQALVKLDGATIEIDESYGLATATAVLTYKRKRNIINRAYQTQPDNIVGKMTMARLDQEIVALEGEVSNPDIQPLLPPAKLAERRSLLEFNFAIFSPGRNGSAVRQAFGPQIPTISPDTEIEIEVGAIGILQINGGIGETLFCDNGDIGRAFDPTEPDDLNNVLIEKNPEVVNVRGVAPGRTTISITKSNSFGLPFGFVRIGLVVKPRSLQSLFNATLTADIIDKPSTGPFASFVFGEPQVPGMAVFGGMFDARGTVDPDPSINVSDFELGIMQALIRSEMRSVYVDAAGVPKKQLVITESQFPIRDSEKGVAPWAKASAVVDLAKAKTVTFQDRPRNVVPFHDRQKTVNLKSSSGDDLFITWLVARRKSTNELIALHSVLWNVNWNATFDTTKETATLLGPPGAIITRTRGEGPIAPIPGGKTANESIKIDFF